MRRTTAFTLYAAVCLTAAAIASGAFWSVVTGIAGVAVAVMLVAAAWAAYRFFDVSKELAETSLRRGRR